MEVWLVKNAPRPSGTRTPRSLLRELSAGRPETTESEIPVDAGRVRIGLVEDAPDLGAFTGITLRF